jgi:hypothetical protein
MDCPEISSGIYSPDDQEGCMTPDDIETIRTLRGSNVPWPIVAKTLKATIQECRSAIGLPEYQQAERQSLPWDQKQRSLFDQ